MRHIHRLDTNDILRRFLESEGNSIVTKQLSNFHFTSFDELETNNPAFIESAKTKTYVATSVNHESVGRSIKQPSFYRLAKYLVDKRWVFLEDFEEFDYEQKNQTKPMFLELVV
jgi:hypothetical protein